MSVGAVVGVAAGCKVGVADADAPLVSGVAVVFGRVTGALPVWHAASSMIVIARKAVILKVRDMWKLLKTFRSLVMTCIGQQKFRRFCTPRSEFG